MLIIYNDINDFFRDNALWLALGVVALIIIVLLIFFFATRKRPKQEGTSLHPLVEVLGGVDNFISVEAKGSRLIIVLKDFQFVEEEPLKESGVQSFIQMSDKVTLVIGPEANEIAEAINKHLNK